MPLNDVKLRDGAARIRVSVVIPFHNEEEPAGPLLDEIRDRLGLLSGDPSNQPAADTSEEGLVMSPVDYEVVAVDDGSTDGTGAILEKAARGWDRLRILHHLHCCGQSAALYTGFAAARGELVATLDGDGQSDPADLPRLLAELGAYDMVTGIRSRRHDSVIRRISSRIAFRVRDSVLHDGIVDTGCSTRVFRRSCLRFVPMQFRGMHRFLPALFQIAGFRVKQVPVNHRPRAGGRAKYGIGNRMIPGLCDLYAVRWMKSRYTVPKADETVNGGSDRR
jgi:dolichol-phosphate mannosyltransferase